MTGFTVLNYIESAGGGSGGSKMPIEDQMPPGTTFTYLGRPCVVLRYADEAEAKYSESGYYGLVYEYVDTVGRIYKNCVAPRDIPAFMAAVTAVNT